MNHDVYAFGIISASTLYRIRGAFPAAEGYGEIASAHAMTGGEAANSSVVLARLGLSVKLDGTRLGDDPAGRRTKSLLSAFDIDTSSMPLSPDCESVEEVVFAAEETRTIFGTYGRLQETRHWNMPNEEDIRHAKVVCLDPFLGDASLSAAEMAARHGTPVVTVDCVYDNPLIRSAAALVIAESYIRERFKDRPLEALFRDYQQAMDGLVIFTHGAGAIWYARPGERIRTLQPYAVEAVDTTGGGDAFRAGIAYGVLKGWEDTATIDFAAAVAAKVCTSFPGVLNAPTFDEVVEFQGGAQRPGLD